VLTASPISDQPLSTRKQDSRAVGTAVSTAMRSACCIKGSEGASSVSIRRVRRGGAAARGQEAVLGRQQKARRNTSVCSTTMTPPVAPSRK
jgi:hypothetical protein